MRILQKNVFKNWKTKNTSQNSCNIMRLRYQTGEKPFICPYSNCDKRFTEKGNLNTHIRIHTGEKTYKCEFPDCGKTFTTQGHLKDHTRRHNNERYKENINRPYVCPSCGAAFLRSGTLKVHIRKHTGERPYICSQEHCGKRFSESGNLSTHLTVHVIDHFIFGTAN